MTRARAAACAALFASGCAGGFDLKELPADPPLAIVYRTRDESERRVELLKQGGSSALEHQTSDQYESSHLNLGQAADALGLGRSKEEKAADLLGRMASVDVRTESVQPFDFAFRGDRPLDWTKDKKRLLFASLRSATVQLYEWDRESGQVSPVTSGPEDHPTGCYLNEGRLAVAGLVRGAQRPKPGIEAPDKKLKTRSSRIYVTAPGGGAPSAVTAGPDDTKPACSPDGRLIVYETAPPGGAPQLMVVPSDGSEPPRAIANGRDGNFTPDGTFVVYSARTRVGWRLAEMHPDGNAKRPLGGGGHDELDPRVSPDGRYVVYVYDDEGRQQLRVRTMDGRKDRPLIWNGDGITPVW